MVPSGRFANAKVVWFAFKFDACFSQFPNIFEKLSPLCLQLDKGVSVRKSVVRTLRGVLLWRKSHPRHNMICRALVERAVVAREEDTIRDLIRDTFQVR